MSRTHKDGRNYSKKQRHISVRTVRRDLADLTKLARAIAAVAIAQAEAEAQANVDALDVMDAMDALELVDAESKATQPDETTLAQDTQGPHD